MCGIFGYAGKYPKTFNKAKFDILGLYNNSRGGDSCGVTADGEIYYGLRTSKNYSDFIVDQQYLSPKINPVVIGHTRKSSIGVVNESNAHPFGFGEHNEGFGFVGCHNGTLSNHRELAKQYEIQEDLWRINEYNVRVFDRTKIDSEILLECLYKSEDIKVLNDYIGGAAVLFQDLKEGNVMYAFHGASRKETGDTDPAKFEERPLYYYRESKNSVYISSIWESLVAIGGIVDEDVFQFDHNIVYKIIDGDIDGAIKYKVNRNDAAQKTTYAPVNYGNFHKGPSNTRNTNTTATIDRSRKESRGTGKKAKYKKLDNAIISNIYDETDDKFFRSGINFKLLRYWRNGHLINGVYTFIKDFGFFPLNTNSEEALKTSYTLLGRQFDMNSSFFVNEDVTPDYKSGNIVTPFPFTKTNEPPLLYFHQGIMLETSMDYDAVTNKFKENFTFEDLSEMSKHPIIDIHRKNVSDTDQRITFNKKLYTKKISFIQSGKIYNIENGNLINIEECENIRDLSVTLNNGVILLPATTDNLALDLKLFREYEKKEISKLNESFNVKQIKEEFFLDPNDIFDNNVNVDQINEDPELDKLIMNLENQNKIEEQMLPIYIQVQEANKVLEEFNNDPNVEEIIEINKDFLLNLNTIVVEWEDKLKENGR
jgi:hypothetical protein